MCSCIHSFLGSCMCIVWGILSFQDRLCFFCIVLLGSCMCRGIFPRWNMSMSNLQKFCIPGNLGQGLGNCHLLLEALCFLGLCWTLLLCNVGTYNLSLACRRRGALLLSGFCRGSTLSGWCPVLSLLH